MTGKELEPEEWLRLKLGLFAQTKVKDFPKEVVIKLVQQAFEQGKKVRKTSR